MSKIEKKRLGDIVNFKRGYDLPSYNRIEGKFPIISSSGISGYHSEYKKEGEGLITGRYGTLGEVYYINEKYWPHNTALYVTDFKGNYPKYTYFLMKCLGNLKTSDKSTVPGINRNDLHEIIVPYIESEFQKPLADCLYNIERKIELNNRINAELEAMAKTLYNYWFVQFDFLDKNGKPYKTNGGKMVWNEELNREVPEGWKVTNLSNLTSLISRGISPLYVETKGVCVLNQKCIREKTVLYSESRRHDNMTKNADSKRIELNDILVNSTGVGTLGRVAIVKRLLEGYVTVDSHVTIVRANSDLVDKYFFGASLLEKQTEIEKFALGSTGQVELSRFQLEGIKLILPPQALQIKFSSLYSQILNKMAICEEENQHLSSLRDWLLPMLMNGQVTVGAKEKAGYQIKEALDLAAEPGKFNTK